MLYQSPKVIPVNKNLGISKFLWIIHAGSKAIPPAGIPVSTNQKTRVEIETKEHNINPTKTKFEIIIYTSNKLKPKYLNTSLRTQSITAKQYVTTRTQISYYNKL